MLKKLFPNMYDCPESRQSVGGLSYCAFPFVVLPFTLILFVIDSNSMKVYTALEFVYQAFNFVMLFCIFRPYLMDSWLNFSYQRKKVLGICIGAALVIGAYYIGMLVWSVRSGSDLADRVFAGALPMTGIELTLLPGYFFLHGGVLAALFLILLGPVTTACMYYTTVFAPLCTGGHPIAAYLSVAALTAVPRIVTWFTVWGGWKEPELYLAQLPIHLLACWTYQKTDTVWAPIFTHVIGNAFCCAVLWFPNLISFFA